jgi:hypothetical protein
MRGRSRRAERAANATSAGRSRSSMRVRPGDGAHDPLRSAGRTYVHRSGRHSSGFVGLGSLLEVIAAVDA